MKYRPAKWYEWLVEQSKTNWIYQLIHEFLPYDLCINHEEDFVVFRKTNLPNELKNIPEINISLQNRIQQFFFPSSDYVIINNNHLKDYLEAAKAMQVTSNSKGENFIELLFVNPENEKVEYEYASPPYIDLCKVSPETLVNKEDALAACWQIISGAGDRFLALQYAAIGEEFLHSKTKFLIEVNSTLQELYRVITGYNIIAVAYAWNNKIDKAAKADKFYIHAKELWPLMSALIEPYLEMLILKKQQDYLEYLFSNADFRKYFIAHYEAFISLLIDDTFLLTQMSKVVGIINRINNSSNNFR